MKVIIRLNIDDADRDVMAQSLGHKGLVSRKQVTSFVEEKVRDAIQGHDTSVDVEAEAETARAPGEQPEERGDQRISAFLPSRGDEAYLYRPKDPRLAAACSAVLDGLGVIDRHVWDQLERNRQ